MMVRRERDRSVATPMTTAGSALPPPSHKFRTSTFALCRTGATPTVGDELVRRDLRYSTVEHTERERAANWEGVPGAPGASAKWSRHASTTASKASTSSSCSCVGVQRGGCASRLELHRSIPERPRPSRLLGAAPRCRSRRRKIGLWSMILVGHGPHGFFQRVRASQNLPDASCEYIYCWGGSMPPLLQGGIVSGRPARTFKMPPKCDAKF